MTKVTVKLSKPIKIHGGETTELKFRELNVEDLEAINEFPYRQLTREKVNEFNQVTERMSETKVDWKVAMNWIVRLSGLDEILVKQLSPQDFMKCVQALGPTFEAMMPSDTVGKSEESGTTSSSAQDSTPTG